MSKSKTSGFSAVVEALAAEDLPHLKELGRRQRRAAETRVRLFRTAVQLFAKRGFSNVTVEDITEAADVGKGTFFNYFESKDHVFGVMAEIQLGKVKEALIRSEAGNETTFATLRRLFSRVGEEPGRSAELTRALISSITGSDRVRIVMSQKFSLYNDLRVIENLRLFAGLYSVPANLLKERIEWALEMANLKGQESLITGTLPGGWKQRLALGCAVLHRPPVIFLDEPTSGVDPISRRQFWELIHQMAHDGVTVFVTTHYMM